MFQLAQPPLCTFFLCEVKLAGTHFKTKLHMCLPSYNADLRPGRQIVSKKLSGFRSFVTVLELGMKLKAYHRYIWVKRLLLFHDSWDRVCNAQQASCCKGCSDPILEPHLLNRWRAFSRLPCFSAYSNAVKPGELIAIALRGFHGG